MELVYRPDPRKDRMAAGHEGFRLYLIPGIVGLVVGVAVHAAAGSAAFVVLAALFYWRSRKQPEDVVVLRVASRVLEVSPMGASHPAFRVALDELEDVVLETKSIERVMDVGANAVNIGMGPLAPNIAAPTDAKRIVLESERSGRFTLTKEYFGDVDTTEWFAKIRSFLRSAGWTPLDEREED